MKNPITLTEAYNYTEKIYLEQGWISLETAKRIRRQSLMIAIAVILSAVIIPVLIIILLRS